MSTPAASPSSRIDSFERDGLVFEVLDEGPLEGEVVVLLHGFPQLNTSWAKVAPLLHAQGYRTLAPNQRGYSAGARPPGRRPYVLPELVADVESLIARLGAPVHLLAHDWGAVVGWALTVRHADLLRTYTAVSVPHVAAFLKAMPRGQALRSWYMALFNIPFLPELLLRDRRRARRFLRSSGMPEEAFEAFWRDFGDGQALRGGLAWYRALPLSDMRRFAGKAHVPTTYVWSTGDTALGRSGAELCERYVEAPYRFEVLEDVSHWIPDEAPEQLATAALERMGRS